jgi:hypothetical protein
MGDGAAVVRLRLFKCGSGVSWRGKGEVNVRAAVRLWLRSSWAERVRMRRPSMSRKSLMRECRRIIWECPQCFICSPSPASITSTVVHALSRTLHLFLLRSPKFGPRLSSLCLPTDQTANSWLDARIGREERGHETFRQSLGRWCNGRRWVVSGISPIRSARGASRSKARRDARPSVYTYPSLGPSATLLHPPYPLLLPLPAECGPRVTCCGSARRRPRNCGRSPRLPCRARRR